MEIVSLAIPAVKLLTPLRIGDERGYFAEVYRSDTFTGSVGPVEFVQDNESLSARSGTVRGLHFQIEPAAQGKLVRCTVGALLDVAVDIRRSSPTFGQAVCVELSAANGRLLWVPPGFAHGFCTLAPNTVINYKVTAFYSAAHDRGIRWNDPALGIDWPASADPETLSPKDKVQPLLADAPQLFS